MNRIIELIKPMKIWIIIIMAAVLVFNVGPLVYEMVFVRNSPVVEIKATNEKVYSKGQKIRNRDFKVTAIHENGKKSSLDEKEYHISRNKIKEYGSKTKIEITYKENKNVACEIYVKNEREKVATYPCGTPEIDQVKAVLYSNGELCFEGEGEVMQYNDGNCPWKEDNEKEIEINSVTFEKNVKPLYMDQFFSGLESLTYVEDIPDSVQSMIETFKGCIALEQAPEWNQCKKLLNINGCYSECSLLKLVPAIPGSVITANEAFYKCDSLQNAPDMQNAIALKYADKMFQECSQLTRVRALPSHLESGEEMFRACINMKSMPEIPESMKNMKGMFQQNLSLSGLTTIPRNVENINDCFSECQKIEGVLWIDANPEVLDGCFNEAAAATKVDLQGNSLLLDAIANTGNTNITVNGKNANPEITRYEDVFSEMEDTYEEMEAEEDISEQEETEEQSQDTGAEEQSTEEQEEVDIQNFR